LDIGNVCIKLAPEACAEALGFPPSVGIPSTLLNSIDEMERGIITTQQWLEHFHSITDNKFTDNQLRNAYNQLLGDEIDGIKKFLQQKLTEGYRIIFFSDISEIHLNCIFRNLSFANLITGGIYSFCTGNKKTEPGMFEAFEQTYGKPDIFLDDKSDNIKMAQKHSWNSYLFTSVDNLHKKGL